MLRDEAKNDLFQKIRLGIIGNGTQISNFIDKIYDSFENKSCDGCIHKDAKDKNELIDYSCLECSRYYTDKFKK
jgi:hypothetical protein